MWRWICLPLAIAATLTQRVNVSAESVEVNLDYVSQRALQRAEKPFHDPQLDLPKVLQQDNLNYDKYRQIRFRRDKALWTPDDLPFRVEFFHPGYTYNEPVHINEFTATHVQQIRFVQDFFDYGNLDIQNEIPANTGYAGFRLLYELNKTNEWDELGAFLGASYFRLLGKNQSYGQSARGLALNCGDPAGEEFPIFTDWWLGKPNKGDTQLTLYALLDSVSCTGAYEFHIRPGETTAADVEAVIYLRDPKIIHEGKTNAQPIKTLGMAPLTSMFWFGKNSERKFDDYRSEVHDSDGLLVKMDNGETLWCPLDNPAALRHQVFDAPDVRGFGLIQRERNFSAYQDSFTSFQDEPSVWVEPHKNWGNGNLHLVELSSTWEGLDNIVAFWDPEDKPKPLTPFHFGYTLYWTRETDMKLSEDKVVSTRIGLVPGGGDARQIIIDFAGPKLDAIPLNSPPTAVASCSPNAAIIANQVIRNPDAGTWRAVLEMQPKDKNPVDLRCTLQRGTNIMSETWVYQWSAP
jgi:glucans biosynthesis protein